MLKITIPKIEQYDEVHNEFVYTKEQVLFLEHSLVSISKWESKWNKPFLSKQEKTIEESIDYIKCMTITQNVDENVYKFINKEHIDQVTNYIEAPMTATTFSKDKNRSTNRETITSEIIYYWMIALNIPFECQKWHLNRLLTLINVCDVKNNPPKKMSRKEVMSRNAALNASRRRMYNTRG
jgi:hypothetical protein